MQVYDHFIVTNASFSVRPINLPISFCKYVGQDGEWGWTRVTMSRGFCPTLAEREVTETLTGQAADEKQVETNDFLQTKMGMGFYLKLKVIKERSENKFWNPLECRWRGWL